MGVLGFTPFLQKACPDVIKRIPTRLRALTGKKIAIDGNLITQRLHFGATSHAHRHVVGWFKVINDLRANGVGVITVWDGKERSSAKAREQARRQAMRLLQLARGTHELGRLRRLQRLTAAVKRFQQLRPHERLQVSHAVRLAVGADAEAQLLGLADVMEKVQHSKPVEVEYKVAPTAARNEEQADRALQKELLVQLYPPEEREALASFLDDFDPEDVSVVSAVDSAYEAALEAIADGPEPEEVQVDEVIADLPMEEAASYYLEERPNTSSPYVLGEERVENGAEKTVARDGAELSTSRLREEAEARVAAADLLVHFPETAQTLGPEISSILTQRSDLIASAPPAAPSSPLEPPTLLEAADRAHATSVISLLPISPAAAAVANELTELYRDFQRTTLMQKPRLLPTTAAEPGPEPEPLLPSRYQAKLTEDEQLFWKRLIAEVAESAVDEDHKPPEEGEEVAVEGLLNRSGHMVSSYEKRNRLPTAETYAEARRLLIAMGVPCIEAEYPFEAEALAASLVIHGYADFVGSEDTDVLVYEAPLLRNLTNSNMPLALISGTEVRSALHLTRDSFVDFALLLGTDFTQRVKNLGPHTAIKLIRAYGSIEKVLESQTKYAPETLAVYMEQIEVARLVFSTLPPLPDISVVQPMEYNEVEVRAILKEYKIHAADLADEAFDSGGGEASLGGNYFGDDPIDPHGETRGWQSAAL
ncbi:PIN domain-like protein [Calocera viscosa TUFC12733]|uniref:PIN domain-like protein n=1 Tax=Calocera viscosa (strain TUFC12733) TaxID=1330018 RepID=A0A167K0R3_CALVF|nr:PIN domain-like protein [Calocera viscosa TUFC12733]